jgi:sigma-E factor negative regulatory protein RseB
MMQLRLSFAGFVLAATSWGLSAQPAPESTAIALLERMHSAAYNTSFSGTFVHQQDSILQTSRIVQSRDTRGSVTRVQSMEGHRQEVIRTSSETRVFMPDRQMIKVDQTGQPRAAFPAVLVGPIPAVLRNYDVVRGEVMRIADVEAVEYLLKPRNESRWPVRIWVDRRTYLVVKCQKLDARGQALEQAAFTELAFPAKLSVSVASTYPGSRDWAVHDASLLPVNPAPSLKFKADTLRGFELLGVYQRSSGSGEMFDTRRYVYSDGVAAVSVFIQPLSTAGALTERVRRKGALSVISREIQDAWVTVIGDIPPEALRQFANTIEWK